MHFMNISGLRDGASYDYYIKCTDAMGNSNTEDYHITVSIGGGSVDGRYDRKRIYREEARIRRRGLDGPMERAGADRREGYEGAHRAGGKNEYHVSPGGLDTPGASVSGKTFTGDGADYRGSGTVSIRSTDNVVHGNTFQGCYYGYAIVSVAGDRAVVEGNTFNLEACSPKSTTQGIYAHAAFGTNVGTVIKNNTFHITDAGGFVRYPIHLFDQGHRQDTTPTKLIADMSIINNNINCEGGCAGAIMVANGGSREGAKVIDIKNILIAGNTVNLPIIVRSCNPDSTIDGVYIRDNKKPDGSPAEVRIDTSTCKRRGVIKNVYANNDCIAPDGCDGRSRETAREDGEGKGGPQGSAHDVGGHELSR
jgi:hypothetical protein